MKIINIVLLAVLFFVFNTTNSWSKFTANYNKDFSRWKIIQNGNHLISYNFPDDTIVFISKFGKNLDEEVIFDDSKIKKIISKYIPKVLNKEDYAKNLRVNEILVWNGDLYGCYNFGLINFSKNEVIQIPNDEYSIPLDTIKQRIFSRAFINKDNNLIIITEAIKILRKFVDNQGLLTTHIDSSKTQIFEMKSNKTFSEIFNSRNHGYKYSISVKEVLFDKNDNLWIGFNQESPNKGGLFKISKNKQVESFDLQSKVKTEYIREISSMQLINDDLYIGYYPKKQSNYTESISTFNIQSNEWTHLQDYLTYLPNPNNFPISNLSFTPLNISDFNEKIHYLGTTGILVKSNNNYEYLNFADSLKNNQEFANSYYHFGFFNDIFFIDGKAFLFNQRASLIINENLLSIEDDLLDTQTELPFIVNQDIIYFKNNEINDTKIYDIVGNLIYSKNVESQIPISNLRTGVYFLSLNNKIYKFIK